MKSTLYGGLFAVALALPVTSAAAALTVKDIPPEKRKIVVGVHESFPWSYSEPGNVGNVITGQEKEIIEAAFMTQNIEVRFQILSYSRLIFEFENKRLDFASPIAFEIPGAFYTDKYLPFRDVAVTLKAKNTKIDQMSDLTGKSLVAYQQAEKVIGPEFSVLVRKGKYQELAERDLQIKMLFDGRVDVVVGESRISSCLAEKYYGKNSVSIHPVFKQVPYGGAAWDKDLVDQFQNGLKAIKQSGVYQNILNRPCPISKGALTK
jgi:polar amino acid transport system substrate-binding protein